MASGEFPNTVASNLASPRFPRNRPTWRALGLALAVGILLLFGSQIASAAAAGPPIRVVLRSCGEIRESEVERIVRAELGSEQSAPEQPSDPTWIVVSCMEHRVLIEVGDVVSRKTLRRNFDFGKASPTSRARLIAIASSELVLASWSELALRPKLRVEPEGAAPSREREQAARSRAEQGRSPPEGDWAPTDQLPAPAPPRVWLDVLPPERRQFRVTALGSVRGFFSTEGALLGGGLRIAEERLVLTSWALDALYETGKFWPSGREYDVDSWSLGGMLYLYARGPSITGRVGAGLRAGLTSASAHREMTPSPSTRVLTPWGWPLLALGISLGPKPVTFELAGEAGYVAVPVGSTAQGGASLRGIWFGAQLGLSLVL